MKRLKPIIVFLIVFFAFGLLMACNIFVRLDATGLPVPDSITTSYRISEVHACGGGRERVGHRMH